MSIRARRAPRCEAARIRRVLALAGCGVMAVALPACESTEQESAQIGRESQLAAAQLAPAHAAGKHAASVRGSAHTSGRPAHGRQRGVSG